MYTSNLSCPSLLSRWQAIAKRFTFPALFAATALCSGADDWTRFRGPNGSGVSNSKAIPAEISKRVINWSIKVKGKGHSSPVVIGNRVFLTSVIADKNKRYVLCYSTGGKKLWEHEITFTAHKQHRFNSFASSTPAADAERVYISWTTGDRHHVLALTHDGDPVWEKDLGFFAEEHGSSSSPVVHGKTLLVSNDHAAEGGGYLAGLDSATGDENWRIQRQAVRASFSTPTIHVPENGSPQAIFSSNPVALTSVDPESGKILWEYSGEFRKDIRTVASPVVADGIVFATAGSGGSGKGSVAVRPTGTDGNPEIAWELTKGLPYVPTPIAHGTRLFLLGDNGIMSCVKAATGEVAWKERVTGESYSSPVCIDNRLYCISRAGKMTVIAASETFSKIAEYDFGSPVHATPAIAGDRMYVRTDERLLSIGKGREASGEQADGATAN